jgi:hypothetical protein
MRFRITHTGAHHFVLRNLDLFLCQNCVTYPPKPRVNTVIYEDTLTHIAVAEGR